MYAVVYVNAVVYAVVNVKSKVLTTVLRQWLRGISSLLAAVPFPSEESARRRSSPSVKGVRLILIRITETIEERTKI